MENGDSNRSSQVKIITQKTSHEILLKAIEQNRMFLLSEKVEETLIMFQEVRSLYIKYGSQEKAIDVLTKAPYNLPYKTAWDYVTRTPELFSLVAKSITREFYLDIHMERIERTYRIAEAKSDSGAMAKCDQNRGHAIEKLLGTNKAIDKELLRLPDVIAAFHPEWFPDVPAMDTNEFLKIKQLYTTKKNRQRKIELEAEDIDFEEVTE